MLSRGATVLVLVLVLGTSPDDCASFRPRTTRCLSSFDRLRWSVIRDVAITREARIVAMLTRMAMKFDGVAELGAQYRAEVDYDYEHRYAEHEHESQTDEMSDPSD